MGFSFNGLSGAAVTVSGGITPTPPVPSATQTIVNGTLHTAVGTNTIYTVPAGKTFYCTAVVMGSSLAADLTIFSDGVEKLAGVCSANNCISVNGGGSILFTCAATKLVTALANAGGFYGCVVGFIQ